MIHVLDFGSQYTQLIAKRLRRLGYKTEVFSGRTKAAELLQKKPAGIIFSGSPFSVGESVDPDPAYLSCGVPLLGLCFGYQYIAARMGGRVEAQAHREYGAAKVAVTEAGRSDPLTKDLSDLTTVWMSHGDSVTKIPEGAELILESKGKPAGYALPKKKIWGLQFHPEVHHSPEGERIFEAFARDICGLQKDWNLRAVLDELIASLRTQLQGASEVVCAVSGGVDSTVMAVLLSRVAKVHALYVDHGFQRAYDFKDLKKVFEKSPNIRLDAIDASKEFWAELKGVADPEKKRQIMGRLFIETFYGHLGKPSGKAFLGQGTIYSDVIESAANDLAPAHKIKSHHNVAGLPKDHNFELIEPLRNFFKDEVREIGALLGIPREFLDRHPFPGPGLSIRHVGPLDPERIEILRRADAILHDELLKRNLYHKTWQALVVLLPIQTVGVMGDGRSYESVAAIRCVSSVDAMTVEATELPMHELKEIASRIVNEVRGVNRVVFDLTSKPPATIEWE